MSPFILALADIDGYIADFAAAFDGLYPGLQLSLDVINVIGDFDGDGGFDGGDIDGFVLALTGGRGGGVVIPEPAGSLGFMIAFALLLQSRVRRVGVSLR